MIQSIQRGFGFLGQAMDMARKDGDLLKPSFYGMGVGMAASMLGAIPIILAALVFGGREGGNIVVYALGALLIFVQYAIAYIFSGMTAHLVYSYLTEGDGRMDKAWEMIKRDWLDILSLAAVSTMVKLVEGLLRGRQGQRNLLGSLLADVLDRVWTSATYFILPAMVIEDLNLAQGVKRATHIIKNNLLLVAVTEIGVSAVVSLIGALLGIVAVLIGVAIFLPFAAAANDSLAPLAIGGALAVLVAGSLIAVISALSSYVTTAYHTCMFLWAREAEKAVQQGQAVQSVPAPAPVAAVLSPA
jgi:hypothetical protein